MPCIVKPLTDDEALDIQMVQNIQRAELSSVEAAKGYAKLLKRHGDVATVAAKVAKGVGEITRFLQLNKLIPPAKESLAKGELLLGHAYELCRLHDYLSFELLHWPSGTGARPQFVISP